MKTISSRQEFLSPKDVSGLLKLSLITVKRYIRDGKLPSVKIGNVRRVKFEDMEKLGSKNAVTTKVADKNTDVKIIPGYMGIKTQILDHIKLEIKKISKENDIVFDVFAGSGTVGYSLKNEFVVYANDVEPFSYIINSLLLDNSLKKEDFDSFDFDSFEKHFKKNINAIESIDIKSVNINKYKENHRKFPYLLFTSYFSGSYFGKTQTNQIDSLRYAIDMVDQKYRNVLLSCLIYACYQTVSSVGSHFAQPKIAKKKNASDIEKKRNQEVKKFFSSKFKEVGSFLNINRKKNLVFQSDFKDLLSPENKKTYNLLKNTSVTYIDPPYTIDHYSRFYHVLNTLVLYDYPERNGKGLYRENRYQSNFSIKSKAYKELDLLISKLAELNSKVVMSYSDGYRTMLTSDQIFEILHKHYKTDSIRTPIKIEYLYSGFGQSAFNKANELLFIATEPRGK